MFIAITMFMLSAAEEMKMMGAAVLCRSWPHQ